MNEGFWDEYSHISRGGVFSSNINIPKSFSMKEWQLGMDTLTLVEAGI